MKKARSFTESNSDILELTKNGAFELIIEDKSNLSDFKFSISEPLQNGSNTIVFKLDYNPTNSILTNPRSVRTQENSVMTCLEEWTELIRSYNEVNLTPEEHILNEYEKEFYTNFEIIDEDADSKPYELDKQIIIHNYFTNVIKLLKVDEEENQELIQEAEIIQSEIPNMTKKVTIKRISNFFAKVRKKSLPLLKEILELGKKEVFKKAVNFLIEGMIDLLPFG
ncbi:hypothetical protein U8527_20770 [Kordia algicida OT-1]|nr:hypothetical protein [Kordia algicida]